MVEGLTATERRARRVYGALVWVAGRGEGGAHGRAARLRGWAERLGLDDDAARDVEGAARAGRGLRLGRDVAERDLLRRATHDVAGDDPGVLRALEALFRRAPVAAHVGTTRRAGPFEESEVGPPLQWRPAAPRGAISGRAAAMSSSA